MTMYVCEECGTDVTDRLHDSEKRRLDAREHVQVFCRKCQKLRTVRVVKSGA